MELKVSKRQDIKIKSLLSEGIVPGIIYGRHIDTPISIEFKKIDFLKLYKESWKSTPITLKWDGIEELVLVHDLQLNPVKDTLIHADFLWLKKWEEVEASVSIFIEWVEALQKKWLEYTLVSDSIDIKAIPSKLMSDIKIDVSELEDGYALKASDLNIWEWVKLLNEEQVILTVYNPSSNKEEEWTTEVAPEEPTEETTEK